MDSTRLKEFNYCPNCGRRFHDNESACAICGIKKIVHNLHYLYIKFI